MEFAGTGGDGVGFDMLVRLVCIVLGGLEVGDCYCYAIAGKALFLIVKGS